MWFLIYRLIYFALFFLDVLCVVLDLPFFVPTAAPCVFDHFWTAANDLLHVALDLPRVVLDLPSRGS